MGQRGFTLIEAVIALGILCGATLCGGQLLIMGVEAMAAARTQTLAVALASARMEQLRGLQFQYDAAGRAITDVVTNLSVDPPSASGPGLSTSGADSIASAIGSFVDYLDAQGRWMGNGPAIPAGAVFVRRWSVDAVDGLDLLVLQVLVRQVGSAAPAGGTRRGRAEARFVTAVARVSP